MKRLRTILFGAITYLSVIRVADAATGMKSVPLPPAEGTIVGVGFSPGSDRLAVIRHVGQRHVVQIVDLTSRQEISHAEILNGEAADLSTGTHFITYSPDARYLLLATSGSYDLSILDATSLQTLRQFALHRETQRRTSLEEGHRYFRGVVSVAVATKAGLFAAVTHDELQSDEVFVGSFSSGQIVRSWNLGPGRTGTELGRISPSLSDDGSRTAVSVVPRENKSPKTFRNLRLYDSGSGQMVSSIRTKGLIGQISLISPEVVVASRIDIPGLFSEKACIEEWNLSRKTLTKKFCHAGRHVIALGTAAAANLVAGFACKIHKDVEGNIDSIPGRIDVWDMKSGTLMAFSEEIMGLAADIQISPNGSWLLADGMLFQIELPGRVL